MPGWLGPRLSVRPSVCLSSLYQQSHSIFPDPAAVPRRVALCRPANHQPAAIHRPNSNLIKHARLLFKSHCSYIRPLTSTTAHPPAICPLLLLYIRIVGLAIIWNIINFKFKSKSNQMHFSIKFSLRNYIWSWPFLNVCQLNTETFLTFNIKVISNIPNPSKLFVLDFNYT